MPFPAVPKSDEDKLKAVMPADADIKASVPPLEDQPDRVTVMLMLDTTRVLNGGQLKARVLAVTGETVDGTSVSLSLPNGLDYVPGSAKQATYDDKTRQLTWAKLALKLGGSVIDDVALTAKVNQAPATLPYTLTTTAPVLKQPRIKTNVIYVGEPQPAQRVDAKWNSPDLTDTWIRYR